MAQSQALITILKKTLKDSKLTYADVAQGLAMSEANVKRLFASQRFSLERLEAVCQLMDMELSDLFRLYEDSRSRIIHLTKEQETELVADNKLLLVAVSVRNRLTFSEITERYQISENECVRLLAKLDKLGLIDLLPNNRIKLRIDENFQWIPSGPIARFFEKQIQTQFLKSTFANEGQCRFFLSGLLSERSHDYMIRKLEVIAKEFTELHRQDMDVPLKKRKNIGLFTALRPFELSVFQQLQRKKSE